jgi:hypothetical protein
MNYVFFFFLILNAYYLRAQFSDDFTDSNLTQFPLWQGDTADFDITANYLLQLNANRSKSTSWLYTSSKAVKNALWEWYSTLDFNPSSTNYYQVYLMSTASSPSDSGSAYYVKVGGRDDEVSLYYRQGQKSVLLIDGKNKRLNSHPVTVRIRVERDEKGGWKLYTDSLGGFSFELEGMAHHDSLTYSNWFGIQPHYSSTRANRFFFDEFVVTGSAYPDTLPPELLAIEINSPYSLELTFSEALDSSFDKKPYPIYVDPLFGKPIQVKSLHTARNRFSVTFPKAILPNKEYYLTLTLNDTAGNQRNKRYPFSYPLGEAAAPFDVVINEIMADPSPTVGLPDAEFVEIYNASNKYINLHNWTLTDNDKEFVFPELIIPPNAYWLLCDLKNEKALADYGYAFGTNNFPSLNNNGDALHLYDHNNQLIDHVSYSSSWYKNTKKASGGWSLERINPKFHCNNDANWAGSTHELGGSPGEKNTNYHLAIDQELPAILKVSVWDSNEVQLLLSKPIDTSIFDTNSIHIDNTAITNWVYESTENVLTLYASSLLLPGKHTLYLQTLSDCLKNTAYDNALAFEVADTGQPKGIVINEILFDPLAGGSDFIELYNYSSSLYDLRNWKLGNERYPVDSSKYSTIISASPLLFPPKSYLVMTEDSQMLKLSFPYAGKRTILQTELPAFGNDSGGVVLIMGKLVIDQMHYNTNQHLPLLQSKEGVSLERIRPTGASNDITNWVSASHFTNYGTPGYQNSQLLNTPSTRSSNFSMPFGIFSPDNDGFRDVMQFNYQLPEPGYSGTINVHNDQGALIKPLLNNSTLEVKGSIHWNGVDSEGTMVPVGIYLFHYALYHSNAEPITGVLPFVLARKLR